MTRLENPESRWERATHLGAVTREELERCLASRVDAAWTVLPGGLANTNVRVGDEVVRIYRRDPRAAAVERALLERHWKTFRVPAIRRAGEGFLVSEYVPHDPLDDARGFDVGRALAEIHGALEFDRAGDLDGSLTVSAPFGDLVGAFLDHARKYLPAHAVDALERVAPRLREVAGPPRLVHADFKVSNLHWTNDDRLLVLDWEFAYAGSALSDIGQILRWSPPPPFVDAFAEGYRAGGGVLVDDWPRWAAAFDLFNLAGLLERHRNADIDRRVEATLALLR